MPNRGNTALEEEVIMEQSALATLENEFPKIKAICELHKGNSGALLMVLQEIQDTYGYIPKQSLTYIAKSLMVSSSHLYGTMTFYDRFRLTPKRKYTIKVCRGTACELNGVPSLIEKLKELFEISEGGEIDNPLFSLEYSACLGECDKSPVMIINDTVYAKVTPEKIEGLIGDIIARESQGEAGESTVA
jgi:NADH:ubiquinone oxidoreductase subunit E